VNGRHDPRQAEVLVQGYAEAALTEQESARLLALLREKPSTVELILETLRDDCLIRTVVREWVPAAAARPQDNPVLRPRSLRWFRFIMTWPGGSGWLAPALVSAVCLAVGVGIWLWVFGPAMGEPILAEIRGTGLSLERAGQPLLVQAGMHFQPGDVLRTPENVTAAITFSTENTRITFAPSTEVELRAMSPGKRFRLRLGKLEASVARQRPLWPMILTTPQAEARVVGTKFSLMVTTDSSRLEVTKGNVRFTRLTDGTAVKVPAGNYAVAASNYELAVLPQTGSILREYWTNIAGADFVTFLIRDPAYPDHPSGRNWPDRFEAPSDWADNYGTRMRGFIHPPITGDYAFLVAAEDACELFLSRNDDARRKTLVGGALHTKLREWPLNQIQHPVLITLKAGRCYYIEALHKAGIGPDHLAVGWKRPDGKVEVIPGECLSPYMPKPKGETQ
jgi:FecR-like protein